jgi:hypothetical protein
MTLSDEIRDREHGKFIETGAGATAVRVIVAAGSALSPTDFFAAGSSGTGTDGATNRVFTLDNTSLTASVRVHITQGGMITNSLVPSTGFTVSHQATGTLVTIKVAVYDADTFWFVYY